VIGNAFTALHWLFAVHEIFNLSYHSGCGAFWGFLDRLAEIQRPNGRYKRGDNDLIIALETTLKAKRGVSAALASLREIMDENNENQAPEAQDPCCSKSLPKPITSRSSNPKNAAKQCLTPATRKRPALPLTPISAVSEELEKLPRLQ
uniref:Uncharacterized protein n=1 Tax=Panagrolaimus sp. JU765 TaxID=591449 RepID=A0AC34RHA8_9BILA